MKKTKKKLTAALAALAFVAGAAVPVLSVASSGSGQYGSYFECLRHCAGSCTFSGRCYLMER